MAGSWKYDQLFFITYMSYQKSFDWECVFKCHLIQDFEIGN